MSSAMCIRSLARLNSLLEAIDGRSNDSRERLEETCAVIMRMTFTFDNGNPCSMLRVSPNSGAQNFISTFASNKFQTIWVDWTVGTEIIQFIVSHVQWQTNWKSKSNMFLCSLMCSDAFLPVPMDNPTGCHAISPTPPSSFDTFSFLTNESVWVWLCKYNSRPPTNENWLWSVVSNEITNELTEHSPITYAGKILPVDGEETSCI